MNILIYCQSKKTAKTWLPEFRRYFLRRQARVFDVYGRHLQSKIFRHSIRFALEKLIPRMDHVFIWNGDREFDSVARALCETHNIPHTFMESGFFPQRGYYTLDRKGVNAKSALMDDDLSWVGEPQFAKLQALRERYLGTRRYTGGGDSNGGYILAPLQIEHDTSIVLHSPYKTMQAFIDHAQELFPQRRIVFKTHPKDKNDNYKIKPGNELVRKGSFLDLAAKADLVYGINSTTLLESALLGAPVTAVGNGFLKQHAHRVEKLLAALADMHVPIEEKDISYWLEKYTNLAGVTRAWEKPRLRLPEIFMSKVLLSMISL
jgi:capsule polysaccharide modification protein KpsS